ncbi:MAG: hypothetical protein QXO87_06765, partial [Desulfurococcaceae archaeon]
LLISLLPMLAFAMWSETLRVNSAVSTGEVDWRIVPGSLIYLDACGLQPGYGFFAGNDWNATYLPQPGAIQLDKDVGCTSVVLMDGDGDGDMDTMNVTLHNTYPYYYTHIAFKVHNSGTIPVKIWRVIINGQEFYELNEQVLQQGVELDLTGDGRPDVLIWWGNNFGIQLHPCQSADISFDLTLLQDAPEGATLTFIVRFEAVQWNEYFVPTLRD